MTITEKQAVELVTMALERFRGTRPTYEDVRRWVAGVLREQGHPSEEPGAAQEKK